MMTNFFRDLNYPIISRINNSFKISKKEKKKKERNKILLEYLI